jgi:RNA polymerase sigma-70 factor (sigma-E family)
MKVAITATAAVGEAMDDDFASFFTNAWPRLFRTALAISGDRGLAEDAVQMGFAKAYASWKRVQAADHPEAYVRRIVVNEVLGIRRRGWWRREQSRDEVPTSADERSLEHEAVDRAVLWDAVSALPPRQRAVVVLRYYADLSEADIADALGCSRGTVKSQAAAGLNNLRGNAAAIRKEEQ